MLALLLALAAHAAPIEVWSYDVFPEGGVTGHDGWSSGYRQDTWYGWADRNGESWVLPLTDDNGGAWGDGGPHDNWLIHDAMPVGDGQFAAEFYTQDDDPVGLVVGHTGDEWYAIVLCGASNGTNPDCPLPLSAGTVGSALIRVTDGSAEILAESRQTFSTGDGGTLRLSVNDGILTGGWDEGNLELEAEVELDHVDAVGFWAYDAGYGGQGGSYVAFRTPSLSQLDDDSDQVADDDDNCETVANTDQADADADGIGDDCDDTPGTDDTGTPGDTDTDVPGDDSGLPGDDEDDLADKEGDLSVAGACACNAGPAALPGLLPLGLALLAARRRRR